MNDTERDRHQAGAPPVAGEHIPEEVAFPVGSIRFRAAEHSDAVPLLAALDVAFAHWPGFVPGGTREDHVRWYLEAWGSGLGLNWIAEHGGVIAGFVVGYYRPTWVRGVLRKGGIGAFGGVDPRYRRMYLYNWLTAWRRQTEGRDVALSFTQVEALKRSEARLGDYHPLANSLTVVARVLRPLEASGRGGRDGLRRAPGYLALEAAGLLQRRPAPDSRCTIREVERFDERVDALDEAASSEFDFLCWRGHEFLNWRYLDPRTGPSIALIAEDGERLLGYVVLRTIGTRVHIADILVARGAADVARALIDAAVRRARHDGAAAIECTLPRHHPYMPALRAAGFVTLRERSRVMAYKFAAANWVREPGLLDFFADARARVHLTIGDSDMV